MPPPGRVEVVCPECGQPRFVESREDAGARCMRCSMMGNSFAQGRPPGSYTAEQLEVHAAHARDVMLDRFGHVEWWTREKVIAAIQAWANRHGGRPPTSTKWRTTGAGATFLIDGQVGSYPCAVTVAGLFGSWNAAIKAAGFKPRTRGLPGESRTKKQRDAMKRYRNTPEGKRISRDNFRTGPHTRWHVNRGIVNPDCEFCE